MLLAERIEQLESSFAFIFLLIPMKVAGGYPYSERGKSSSPGAQWYPWSHKRLYNPAKLCKRQTHHSVNGINPKLSG